MGETVNFTLNIPAKVVKKGRYYVSCCPPFDVYSQGENRDIALKNLVEAMQLFVVSCFERGVLDQVLKECGFTPTDHVDEGQDMIEVPLALLAQSANAKAAHC